MSIRAGTDTSETSGRRTIPSRGAPWAIALARWLQRAGVRPNQISVLGVVFAALAALCFVLAGRSEGTARTVLLLLAAGLIPLRLLCNLLDGMLAVEGGLQTASGELFNELPDRVADLLIIAGAGYAAPGIPWAVDLGWAAAASAVLTAYTRTLGVAAGADAHFAGPMAKPRRMHVLIVAAVLAAVATVLEPGSMQAGNWILVAALAIILIGDIITIGQRLRRIVADLEGA
jgi:phosphatidylglycerophosphate synthase